MTNLEDFDSIYGAASAGIAVRGEGKSVINTKNVQIVFTSSTTGASLKVAAEGLKTKLEK